MPIQHHKEKLADAVIYFLANTQNCGVTKLVKLLFFLDFMHFRETGQSVTGQTYRTWKFGPAPSNVWREIANGAPTFLSDIVKVTPLANEESGKRFTRMEPKRPFDGRFFTKREKRILSELAEIYREATAEQLVDITHLKNSPWSRTLKGEGENAVIDYMLALDGKSPRELSVDEVRARLAEDEEEIRRLTG